AEILVLIVAPDHDEIRVEVVQYFTDCTEVVAKALAAAICRRQAVIIAQLGDQLVRPVGRVLVPGLDIRSRKCPLEHAGQPFVRQAQRRPMGYAETQYFRHIGAPSCPWEEGCTQTGIDTKKKIRAARVWSRVAADRPHR